MPHTFPFYLTAERRRPDREELDKLLTRVGSSTPPPQGVPRDAVDDQLDDLELACAE
jgi:hypothetical protein